MLTCMCELPEVHDLHGGGKSVEEACVHPPFWLRRALTLRTYQALRAVVMHGPFSRL